ncbi:MAG: tetratricopeptide repeat protein [Pseudomonadota bacterium]
MQQSADRTEAEVPYDGQLPFVSASGEASYHVLMGEIALSRGEWGVSASEYRKAAELSNDPQTAERAARVAFDHGLWEDAHASARRWYALAPTAAGSRSMLTALEVRRGNRTQARALLDRLLGDAEREGWLGDGISMAAALLNAEGAWDTALPLMEEIESRYPQMPESHASLATLYLRAELPERALAPAREAVRLDPEWLRAHTLLATVLLELREIDEALDVASTAATLADAGPDYRLRHAMLLISAGRDSKAEAMLAELVEEYPNMAAASRQAGLLAQRQGRYDDARAYFRRLLGTGQQVAALYFLGRTEDLAGNRTGALHFYQQVTGGEYLLPAQVRVAALLGEQGRVDEAIDGLDLLAQTEPQHAIDAVEASAAVMRRAGRQAQALATYEQAIARWPQEQGFRYERAFLLLELDRVSEAVTALEALVEDYPEDANALNALGYTLADRTDRHREALRFIQKALSLDPENPAIIDSLGWVEYRRGRLGRAIGHLERAYALLPDPEIAAHLGEVLWISGRREDAQRVWRAALDSFPGDQDLSAVMARFAD